MTNHTLPMDHTDTPVRLCGSYRNLLITLARDSEALRKEMEEMRVALPAEPSKGKQAGMRTLINARSRQRARLLQILSMNNTANRAFFGSTRPERIAQYEIQLN